MVFNGSTHFEGPQHLQFDHVALLNQGEYTDTDLTLTYYAPSGQWHVGAFVKNLEDDSVLALGTPTQTNAKGAVTQIYADFKPPQTYGVSLGFKFTGEGPAISNEPPPASAPPPPPPAPAAAAPEAQRTFQVFFDFDKSAISADAAKIIAEAADAVKSGKIAHINVIGHTDTVGSAKYNQKLSERRALAVKEQLLADGLPAEEISTSGVGKTGLLVPTPDGVREPQNRRAEIDLGGGQS
jgi:outer membrane protein OmpA-like peptidoglycan-associated protein